MARVTTTDIEGDIGDFLIDRLMLKICKIFKVSEEEIVSKLRTTDVKEARFTLTYILLHYYNVPKELVLDFLGMPRVSVRHHIVTIEDWLSLDMDFKGKFLLVLTELGFVYKNYKFKIDNRLEANKDKLTLI